MAPPAKFSQANRPLQVTTPLGADVLLLEKFSGAETLSEPFKYTLDLLAETSRTIDFGQLLGQSVTVTLTLADQSSRYFNGIISFMNEAGIVTDSSGVTVFNRFRAELVPSLWNLTRNAQSRVFQQLSVKDILTQVLSSLTIDTSKLTGTYQPRDHCFQYRETDFDFASRLMEEEGIFYYFTHANGSHTMVLGDSPQAHSDISGDSSVAYWRESSDVPFEEWIDRWVRSQGIRSGKYTLWDHNQGLTTQNLAASQSTLASVAAGTITQNLAVGGNSGFEIYDYPGEYAKRFDATAPGGDDQSSQLQNIFDDNTRTVGIRMQQETVSGLFIDGTASCRRLATGCKFTLTGHPNANGSYVLTRVTQNASLAGSYGSGKSGAFDYDTTFRCIPAALPFRPQRTTPQPRVAGSQTAMVVGPSGQEIFTDKYGRVKVQFFWDRTGTNDANSSCWIRVATPWAGKQWGTIHIPRIGMEVLVDFLEGDPDRPIIVGCVYNDVNMPPFTLPDNATQSGIKSRSSAEGDATMFNELMFEDKKGSELIYCHAQKDFTRVVLNNDSLTVGSSDTNTCSDGSQTIDIYKDRTETVETGNESVTIKQGNRSVTVSQGNDSHTVSQGNRSVTISQGNDTFQVSAGKRDTTISQNDTLEIQQGDRIVKIDTGNDTLTVSTGNQSITISSGNQTTTVSVGSSTTEATQGITLKCGSNSIQITPSGITISGAMVTITGQGNVAISGAMVAINS